MQKGYARRLTEEEAVREAKGHGIYYIMVYFILKSRAKFV